jgi:hypothetical protein
MSGTFTKKYPNPNPKAGDKVVIFVDDKNSPTGVWEGVLTKVSADRGVGSGWAPCSAKIVDKRARGLPGSLYGFEPIINYDVRSYEEALPLLMESIEEQKREIKGLQKRMKNERDVLYGALKAMVSPEATKKLEELVELLLKK